MADTSEAIEITLFRCNEVNLFKLPPRPSAGGRWLSGEWQMKDKIFTGRLRVVEQGPKLEIRLEDTASGELFGLAPVPRGQAGTVADPAADSSRNFVLRLEDAESRRHAFVGLNFTDRAHAFDFNVALADHEKQARREEDIGRVSGAADPRAAAAAVLPEAALLYEKHDLSLKPGETIRISVKKRESSGAEGSSSSWAASSGPLVALAGPPAPPGAQPAAPRPAASVAPAGPPDLLQLDDTAAALQGLGLAPHKSSAPAAAAPAVDGWATFD